MKKIAVLSLLLLAAVSCNFNKSFQKDFSTGFNLVGDGVSCENVEILVSGDAVQKPIFNFGDELSFNFSGLDGFQEEGGKYFVGVKMTVKDAEGNVVYTLDDLFGEANDGVPADKNSITASLTMAKPIFSGQKYKLSIYIWDKKSKGNLKADLAFELIGNDAIEISGEEYYYDEIYLFSDNNKAVISDNVLAADDKVYLVVDGLSGLSVEEGLVFPIISFTVLDMEGNEIFTTGNMFAEYEESGIKESDLAQQLTLSFDQNLIKGMSEFILKADILDQVTEKSMQIETQITVE